MPLWLNIRMGVFNSAQTDTEISLIWEINIDAHKTLRRFLKIVISTLCNSVKNRYLKKVMVLSFFAKEKITRRGFAKNNLTKKTKTNFLSFIIS